MAHTTSWTDGQAESWTIFSQGLDAIILGLIIVFISVGTFLSLRLKRKWLNFLIAVVAGLITWLIFYLIQLSLQQHFSRFSGV